jgi:predicted kinase
MIILLAGLPGTGKTTLGQNLASRTGGVVLNKDVIRATLFPGNATEYTTEQDDFVMKIMLETAGFLVATRPDRMIFLDGRPFAKRYQIDQVLEAACAMNQSVRMLLCVCSEETARNRLAEGEGHPAGNRDFALYLRIKAGFEELTTPHTVINTDWAEKISIEQALAALRSS